MVMQYGRFSLIYFLLFSPVGIFLPYWALYLQSLHFTAAEIGALMAFYMAAKIVSPNFWAWLADRTARPLATLRIASLMALFCLCQIFHVTHFWSVALVMFSFNFFWNAVIPLQESVLLSSLAREVHRYSSVRLWGSIGFVVMVVMGGWWVDAFSARWVPIILLGIITLFFLSTWLIQERREVSAETNRVAESVPRERLGALLKRRYRDIIALFSICFLMQASHSAYYTYYTIYLESYGYSTTVIGWLWSIGVMAEIVLFMLLPRYTGRWSGYQLVGISLLLATLRWLLMAWLPDNGVVVVLMQLLHAATYGAFHVAIIVMITAIFEKGNRSSGQAFYGSIGYGVGGALGAYAASLVWDHIAPNSAFLLGAALACLGWLLNGCYFRKNQLGAIKV